MPVRDHPKRKRAAAIWIAFNDARMAAVEHGFPHFVLDIREEFGTAVIDNFVEEYLAGRTRRILASCAIPTLNGAPC